MKGAIFSVASALPALVSGYKPLSDGFLRLVPSGSADFDVQNGKLLSPLLVPRVPGTAGQARAQQHFVDFFRTELPRWALEWQNSTAKTDDAEVPIANLIFRREPPWTKPGQANLLTLAAHYDTASRPISAVDSAASCAILMHVARSLDRFVTQMHDEMEELGEGGTVAMDMGVQIVLLDGREALGRPSDLDGGLYGSRALAEAWETSANPAMVTYGYRNPVRQIPMFVLLDLLGAINPNVSSRFQTTHWAYQSMAAIEARMRNLSLLETQPPSAFLPDASRARFGTEDLTRDDYVPFMDRGVPALLVAPAQAPPDDGQQLDAATVGDWSKVLTAFALEWLDMMEVEPTAAQRRRPGRLR